MESYKEESIKYREMFKVMYFWIQNINHGKRISDYLKNKNVKKIVIYGAGDIGKCLCEELVRENIDVLYFLDKNKIGSIYGVPIKKTIICPEEVDFVIVTTLNCFFEVKNELQKNFLGEIEALDNIIYKL